MLHPEGRKIVFISLLILAGLNVLVHWLSPYVWLTNIILLLSIVLYALILYFFRNPKRFAQPEEVEVLAPADGKVVVIQEVEEPEFFKDKRIQVSIFMSPVNVHVNRYPISGTIEYAKYHKGDFLVAWHPKSSVLNERTTVVVTNSIGQQVLYRQIAGALARRIVMYAKAGMKVKAGTDSGFIKFGSRVDLFFPLGTEIMVKEGDRPRGGETVVAKLPL